MYEVPEIFEIGSAADLIKGNIYGGYPDSCNCEKYEE
jgi:hypothetical protein